MLDEAAKDVLPLAEVPVDSALLQKFMSSNRILKFMSEALEVEIARGSSTDAEGEVDSSPPSDVQNLSVEELMLSLPLRIQPQNSPSQGLALTESSLKQLKKDVERDALVINGRVLVGSELKLEGCFSRMCEAIESVLVENGLPLLCREGAELLSFHVLTSISRTHSGGVSFQALRSTVDTEATLIVPNSASAPPLRVVISVGSFAVPSGGEESASPQRLEWGLLCRVLAVTSFRLKAVSHLDEEVDASATDHSVRVAFEDAIGVPIDPRLREISLAAVERAVRERRTLGKVTILEDRGGQGEDDLISLR